MRIGRRPGFYPRGSLGMVDVGRVVNWMGWSCGRMSEEIRECGTIGNAPQLVKLSALSRRDMRNRMARAMLT